MPKALIMTRFGFAEAAALAPAEAEAAGGGVSDGAGA
jgi:hypothetical protein